MPLKIKVKGPREGGGRVMSATDASKATSTPPKTGTDAQVQRMNNTIKSFMKSGLSTGAIGKMYRKALEEIKKDPPNYKGKAYGGKTKMASGGRAKKMYGGMTNKKK